MVTSLASATFAGAAAITTLLHLIAAGLGIVVILISLFTQVMATRHKLRMDAIEEEKAEIELNKLKDGI